MFMATKTLTIMDDAYKLLLENKMENESFSEVVRRVLSKKESKKLSDFFGVLSDKEGSGMLRELEKSRKNDIRLEKERVK